MGAYEDDRLPWLTAEKRVIGDAVGVLPVFTTDAARSDPVFGLAPAEFPALQWHADMFALPAGAARLAHSAACPEQAFVVARAYALQFHLEIDAGLATA